MSTATIARPPAGEFLVRLPVSARSIRLRPPTGTEDLLLLESGSDETKVTIQLAESLGLDAQGLPLAWGEMCATDLDAFVLHLRRHLLGDRIQCDVRCASPGCGERIDIEFGISQFLTHYRPAGALPKVRGWTLIPPGESAWFRMEDQSPRATRIEFRLPTANDQSAVAGQPDAAEQLARRCLQPAKVSARLKRRIENVLNAIAPSLSRELQGVCPACGATVTAYFDARSFCLQELRNRAAFIFEDIDLLARRYHWSENDILGLPQSRRTMYAELARRADDF